MYNVRQDIIYMYSNSIHNYIHTLFIEHSQKVVIRSQAGSWKQIKQMFNQINYVTLPIRDDVQYLPIPRAFISLRVCRAWGLARCPQCFRALRTALNVCRFGWTFCWLICFSKSWCPRRRTVVIDLIIDHDVPDYNQQRAHRNQVPSFIVFLSDIWSCWD